MVTEAQLTRTEHGLVPSGAGWYVLNMRDADRLFLQGTGDPLSLALPSGPERSVMDNLQRWLPAATSYDPMWFQNELQAIRASLR